MRPSSSFARGRTNGAANFSIILYSLGFNRAAANPSFPQQLEAQPGARQRVVYIRKGAGEWDKKVREE